MPSQKNIAVVDDLKAKFEKAEVAVMLDYRGLNAEETEQLRSEARKAGIELRVKKNRLIKLALQSAGCDTLDDVLKDPTMVAFGYDDPVATPKILVEYLKKNEKIVLKGGLHEKKALSAEGVRELASLPSREELIARLLGSIGPQNLLGRMVRSLKNPVQKLPIALAAVAKQKS